MAQAKQPTSLIAIAALVCGILSIIIGWIPIIGWTIILLAIILGGVGISETKKRPGRWMAVTGLVLGILSIVIMVAALGAFMLFVTTTSTSQDSYESPVREEYVFDQQPERVIQGPARIIAIEGNGQNRTIDSEEPVELSISGAGNNVYIASGTQMTTVFVDGFDHTLTFAKNTSVEQIIDAGANTQIFNE